MCYITLAHTFFARPSGARAALCPAVSHIMADSESDNDSTASSQVTDIFFATPSPLAQAAHNGHDMIVRACLASGTDPNGSYEGGGCALVYAMGSVHPLAQRLPMSGKELIDEFERRKDTMTPEQLEKVRESCGVYLRRRGEIVDSDESDSEEELYVRLRGLVG